MVLFEADFLHKAHFKAFTMITKDPKFEYVEHFSSETCQVHGGLEQVGRGLRDQVGERQLHRRQHTANVFQVIAKNQVGILLDISY